MNKVLWHTITIKVPSEMVEITKTGKVSIKKTLTKMNNISRSQGYPSIELISSSDNKSHIIAEGKEWNIEQLKTNLKKSNELSKKNKGRNVLTQNKKLSNKESENQERQKVIGASWDIGDTRLKNNYIPNINYIKKLELDGKPFWTSEMDSEYRTLNRFQKSAYLRQKLLDFGEYKYNNQYWNYI